MTSQAYIDRKFYWWQQERKKGNHIFHCPDCDDWTSVDDKSYHEAETVLECEYCGTLILNEIYTSWQCLAALDDDYQTDSGKYSNL